MCICGKVEPLTTCAHDGFSSGLIVFTPGLSLFHVVEVKTCTLVVARIEPEHTGKYLFCFPDAAEPPQAEAVTVQTAEERSIVYASPRKETVKILAEGELADLDPDLVIKYYFRRGQMGLVLYFLQKKSNVFWGGRKIFRARWKSWFSVRSGLQSGLRFFL